MKTSQTTNSNNKMIEKIWNLVILTLLGINLCFIAVTLYHLPLYNTQYTLWHTFLIFFSTMLATFFLTSKIHEYGHAIAIHHFKSNLKVKIGLAHIDCDWKKIDDRAIPIIAVAGVFTASIIVTIVSATFYFLGLKLIHIAIITANNLQFLVNMLNWKSLDGYALFHPLEFKLKN